MIVMPFTTLYIFEGTLSSVMEFAITPMIIAPTIVPTTLPFPPRTLVPPITAAAIASNSSVELTLDYTAAMRQVIITVPKPAHSPAMT